MTFSQNDIQLLFLGKDVAKTTTTIEAMNNGEIGIFTPSGARLTEAAADQRTLFRIVAKTATGEVIDSGIINAADITAAKTTNYVASQEMIVNIGYNGTSGSIDEINANLYTMRINLRQSRVSNHGGLYIKHAFHTSSETATQLEIASNLLLNTVNEFSKEPDTILKPTMLCNHAGAAMGAAADTVVGVEGSKYVVVTDTGADTSVIALSAGDLFRAGTATTAAVYEIVASTVTTSGGILTLKSPLTADVNLLGTTAEYITAAQAATADFGIQLTGSALPYTVGKLNQDLNANVFDVTLENFGSTTFAVTQAAKPGVGTQKQIQNLEFFLQGNEGDVLRTPEPNVFTRRSEATGTYDLIDVTTVALDKRSIVTGPIRKVFTLAIPSTMTAGSYPLSATADDITDVLEKLAFGATTGNPLTLG